MKCPRLWLRHETEAQHNHEMMYPLFPNELPYLPRPSVLGAFEFFDFLGTRAYTLCAIYKPITTEALTGFNMEHLIALHCTTSFSKTFLDDLKALNKPSNSNPCPKSGQTLAYPPKLSRKMNIPLSSNISARSYRIPGSTK
jgi:hypothetical protein